MNVMIVVESPARVIFFFLFSFSSRLGFGVLIVFDCGFECCRLYLFRWSVDADFLFIFLSFFFIFFFLFFSKEVGIMDY
ncbi:hypothetical protein C8Q69DRAFT_477134 [Paecilomyces variotii]|uniref:Uncharacterized protein n=1 Tax=Byssochlamys spectabilis TaxID=264951 RepID=A0A443HMH2_BYSSP|nr:hypothetical protein C8Q69DRAFT_477134 [Paecilomyces variotii]RWQ93014.1 hypothetical protein C8Q69DRAFT_477134 [Paecilomyces variotii]